MRRALGQRKLLAYQDVWPIQESAGRKPDGWPGWPDGKKFAVVLTHDVEGPGGLAKCPQLMQLEKKLGFCSSFNFIPEGDYKVSRETREELVKNGFEVGVHDLNHDGKLYRSRGEFAAKAARINHYFKEWGACGFRSGFMHHNLEWAHDLDMKYDGSTFDTDPFEPQPDGVNTIFPFWVSSPNRPGYLEMPYTLPQDFTMFIILRERGPEIWKKKLDWIVERGGMVLVNVHPDYLNFGDQKAKASEFPASYYESFLQYVAQRYAGQYWHALPREVAEFGARVRPARPNNSSKRICMVSYSHYEGDNRVMRYAEALAKRGDSVDAIAIKVIDGQPDVESMELVRVNRLQFRSRKLQQGKLSFLWPILKFWLAASLWLVKKHNWRRYDVIHVHNVPDFLVFAAWWPRIFGAKIILDIHDIVPEFYASKFGKPDNSFIVKALKRVEKASARFADHVIISNHLWREKYSVRTGANGKCSVFINNVDSNMFRARPRTRNDGKLIVLFPGGLQWHQGLDIAIRAFQKVSARLPQAEFHIYGDGDVKDDLVALTQELGLEQKVRFFNPLPLHQIVEVIANSDLGVVPKRGDSFGNEAYSTKIMEFMSLGIPVVVSNTKIDRYYFNDSVVRFFESGNPDALATAVLEVLGDEKLRRDMVRCASEYVVQNSWENRKNDYLQLVDSLN